MSIKNEVTGSRKYDYLRYVEFLEFLGRVALNINPQKDVAVDVKVGDLLKSIYESLEKSEEYIELNSDSDDN